SRQFCVEPVVFTVENRAAHIHGADTIPGTNSFREFSGWNEGLAAADMGGRFDWYVFSNDTFAHHRFFWGSLFYGFNRQFRRVRSHQSPMLIGDVVPGQMLDSEGDCYLYAST